MKKLIKFLLGNAFIKSLVISLANELLSKFTQWILKKAFAKFGHLLIYSEIAKFLTELSIEDFLKENDSEITKIADNV